MSSLRSGSFFVLYGGDWTTAAPVPMPDDLVITEKTSQAKDVRAAVGARCGPVLAAEGRTREALEAEELESCLLRRWASPREIAYPILWLASDEASYVTASALMADGGMKVL